MLLRFLAHILILNLSFERSLMHKAVGWMLREAGKKDEKQLIDFLDRYISQMPRTAVRYAIETFPEEVRKNILQKK
ncbi:MAG: DNA alkylation repair protein [Rickettsia sp.]|uniref:DNA alkylation repair protein n=1 Tax=Rickettsia sp. TaxID=789 RepID=UPI003979B814